MSCVIGEVQKSPTELKYYEETKYEWKIDNIFSLLEIKRGAYRNSPNFSLANGSEWYFQLVPQTASYPRFMRLNLNSNKEREYAVEYEFGLKRSDGNVFNFISGILKGDRRCTDYDKFIHVSELQSKKSEWTQNDALTVTCSLRRKVSPPSLPTNLEVEKPMKLIGLDRMSENYKDLFGDKETCDTTLKVKGKDYKAHRTVLMARSPVFAATFKHDTSEKQTGVITIPDCDPDSFEEFLQYLYYGKLEKMSFRSALSLYVTSDKYDTQELKEFCVECLKQCLTKENFCEIVVIADNYDEAELFSFVQEFFNQNSCEIVETSEWENLLAKHHRLANKLLKVYFKNKAK